MKLPPVTPQDAVYFAILALLVLFRAAVGIVGVFIRRKWPDRKSQIDLTEHGLGFWGWIAAVVLMAASLPMLHVPKTYVLARTMEVAALAVLLIDTVLSRRASRGAAKV